MIQYPRPYGAAILFACALFSISTLHAEEPDGEVPTLVITPNRQATPLRAVGSSVSVVGEEELERTMEPTVLEQLRSIPGVEVVQSGGPGRVGTVFIRGAESDHTLVLIDGVRVNSTTVGSFDFADLSVENIERIEVLRGPQSVLYGSDAIGGVINIITRSADSGVSASALAEAGSYGTQRYAVSGGWGAEQVRGSLAISYLDTDGISAASSGRGNSEGDAYDIFSISGKTGATFLNDGTADISLRVSRSDAELDGFEFGVGAVDDLNATQQRDFLSGSFVLSKPIAEIVTPRIELGVTEDDLEGRDPDDEFNNFEIDSSIFTTTTSLDIEPQDGWNTTLGYTFEERDGDDSGNYREQRDVNAYFGQQQFSLLERYFLTAGVRHDNDSVFGGETTYRVTAAVVLEQTGTRVHGSLGSGYKAPTFSELYFPDFGNPNLEPETSRGYDLGVEQKLLEESLTVDVTLFRNDIDDLITFDSETFIAENIEEASIQGVEASLDYRMNHLIRVVSSYTYTDSENETTGGILPRRPRHRGSLDLYLEPLERLDGVLSFLLVNSRRESDGERMDNYERVDLTVRYEVLSGVRPYVRVENLFDEDYEEIVGFGTPGFSAYGGIQASL